MKTLTFISLAFSGALAVALWLAIGEEQTPVFLPLMFIYSAIALFAQALAVIARSVNR
jgi:hypothetical protein